LKAENVTISQVVVTLRQDHEVAYGIRIAIWRIADDNKSSEPRAKRNTNVLRRADKRCISVV
jgi:hypothetical protein